MSETVGTDVIRAVEAILRQFLQVEMERVGDRLVIKGSTGGFDIEVRDEGHEATIDTGVWHEHSSDPEDAAMLVAWLLSPRARIVARYRRSSLVGSDLELLHNNNLWRRHGGFGILVPVFGKRSVQVFSNNVLSPNELPAR
jgi:hypothetical protein